MFAFAPLVGLGRRPVRPARGARAPAPWCCSSRWLLAGTSPAGASYRIAAGLFLLGLGWSLCTIAGSTLLSESAPLDARTDVQGAADLVMGLTAAAAGALAGVVVGSLRLRRAHALRGGPGHRHRDRRRVRPPVRRPARPGRRPPRAVDPGGCRGDWTSASPAGRPRSRPRAWSGCGARPSVRVSPTVPIVPVSLVLSGQAEGWSMARKYTLERADRTFGRVLFPRL